MEIVEHFDECEKLYAEMESLPLYRAIVELDGLDRAWRCAADKAIAEGAAWRVDFILSAPQELHHLAARLFRLVSDLASTRDTNAAPISLGEDWKKLRAKIRDIPTALALRHVEQHRDGPFEPFGFRFAGVEVEFPPNATLRFRLVSELWDSENARLAKPKEEGGVLESLWPNNDRAEGRLKNLVFQVNKNFGRAHPRPMPLKIQRVGGKVWMELLPC